MAPTHVAVYAANDGTDVSFELVAGEGFVPAGPGEVIGLVRDAVRPAVAAAREVLDQFKELGPDSVDVTFGIKVNGKANWIIASAATEASFGITLRWSADSQDGTRQPPTADSHSDQAS